MRLVPGGEYVVTVLVDNMGNGQNGMVGGDEMKAPRGVMDWRFEMGGGGSAPEVRWKVTGNLGGEEYVDKVRGPLNEGGLFAERMGYHQPGVPEGEGGFVEGRSPLDGIDEPGVGFWRAEMVLDIPGETWDVPLSFEFPEIDAGGGSGKYRAVLWVNGFRKSFLSLIVRSYCLLSLILPLSLTLPPLTYSVLSPLLRPLSLTPSPSSDAPLSQGDITTKFPVPPRHASHMHGQLPTPTYLIYLTQSAAAPPDPIRHNPNN